MAFVKLDCGILDSTLWVEREAREVFITALLMAKPAHYAEPVPQIDVRSTEETGWHAPPGWYGYVEAAGPGIARRAGVPAEAGLAALEKLGNPDPESRTPDHEGRRMIRIDGGYLILNYDRYRNKDHTAAKRSAAYRERKASRVTVDNHTVTGRSVTQAEAYADIKPLAADAASCPQTNPDPAFTAAARLDRRKAWIEAKAARCGLRARPGETYAAWAARVKDFEEHLQVG